LKKLYVIDTSVLIHDPDCIYKFIGNDIAIPIFVIVELDDLKEKKNKPNVAFASRCASRTIQNIHALGNIREGVHLETQDINVKVIGTTGGEGGIKALQESNNPRKMDLWILQSALNEQSNYEEVILVSKDLNLRLLAEGEGLLVEDYETNKVLVSDVYKGFRDLGEVEYSAELYIPELEVEADEWVDDPLENEFYISHTEGKTFLSRNLEGVLVPVAKEFSTTIQPRNIEQRMALDILLDPDIKLICLVGKAGTGKTILALAGALAQLHNPYDKIMLSKPIIDMGNSIGFLPGELDDKLAPWMESYFDNLSQLIPNKTKLQIGKYSSKDVPHWKYLLDTGSIVMQPINSIRGRSISDAYMIIDEAQNLTPHEVKTLITRAAEGTKVILMGDPFQVDNPFLDQNSNGLTYVCEKMKGSKIFGAVFFSQGVRSELAEEAATRL